jgi:hypothetical protein
LKTILIEKAISEIENPTFGTTQQYLEVLEIEFINGKPKVERIDFTSYRNVNVVYFPIKDEPFFLSVFLSKKDNKITNVATENGNQVYLTATSKNLSFNQLSEMTKLKGLSGWSVGDLRPNGKCKYNFSRLSFEPIKSRAYDLNTKLRLLLAALEKDFDGVKKLVELADVTISVHQQLYIDGNKGIHLDPEIINRMGKLNLGIDIDQYVHGNELN